MTKPQLFLLGILGFNLVVLLNWAASLNPLFLRLQIAIYLALGAFLFVAWRWDDGVRQFLNLPEYGYDALIVLLAMLLVVGGIVAWM
jgi:hypothetical protein